MGQYRNILAEEEQLFVWRNSSPTYKIRKMIKNFNKQSTRPKLTIVQ